MIEQDYVAFCNFAYDLRQDVERFFAEMGEDRVHQLRGLVKCEIAATPDGKVEPAYDFLAAILAEDAVRDQPAVVGTETKGWADDLPF